MGARGMEHMIKLLKHEPVEEKELILDSILIERKSHRCILEDK
jgi:DNA-binding LacI/PurR family transcriptional regulator